MGDFVDAVIALRWVLCAVAGLLVLALVACAVGERRDAHEAGRRDPSPRPLETSTVMSPSALKTTVVGSIVAALIYLAVTVLLMAVLR